MLQLLNRFVDICLLRQGPQALPASPLLAALSILGYFALIALAKSLLDSPEHALSWALFATALLALCVYLMLRIRGVSSRMLQTLSALSGCGILYLMVYLPLSAAMMADGAQSASAGALLFPCWIVVFFWGFVIEGHIYRHALSISMPGGVLISVLLFALVTVIYGALFGASP